MRLLASIKFRSIALRKDSDIKYYDNYNKKAEIVIDSSIIFRYIHYLIIFTIENKTTAPTNATLNIPSTTEEDFCLGFGTEGVLCDNEEGKSILNSFTGVFVSASLLVSLLLFFEEHDIVPIFFV